MSNKPDPTSEQRAMALQRLDDNLDMMVKAVQLGFKSGASRERVFEAGCFAALDQLKSKRDKLDAAALLTMALMRLAEQEMITKN